MLPQHSLDRSASILNQNAEMKSRLGDIQSATAVLSQKLWSRLPTAQHLTETGEGLVVEQWNLRQRYISQRVDNHIWRVVAAPEPPSTPSAVTGLIPLFSRVREVYVSPDGILFCSCHHFERIGIPCRHQMHILCSLLDGYSGITHHDVSVRWWNTFMKYGFSTDPGHHDINRLYRRLLDHDTKGPSLPHGMTLPPPVLSEIGDRFLIKPAAERCRNYEKTTIQSVVSQTVSASSSRNQVVSADDVPAPYNTQQVTFTYGSDEDGSDNDEILVFPDVGYDNDVADDRSPYSVIVPLAKELASILEGNSCAEKLKEYEDLFSNFIVKEKAEVGKARGMAKGRMISSSVQSNKKLKTHGTKHMNFS